MTIANNVGVLHIYLPMVAQIHNYRILLEVNMNEKQILFNVLLFGMFNIIRHLAVLAILSNRTKDFPYQAVGKCRCQCSVELGQLLVYLK